MEIAKIVVKQTTGMCLLRNRIPAGIVGATVAMEFDSPVWDKLKKTVVFRGCCTKIAECNGNIATIPHEVVAQAGHRLYFGIFGHNPETGFQLPLIEVHIGAIEAATDPGTDPSADPTLPVWAQLQKNDEDLDRRIVDLEEEDSLSGYYTPAVTRIDKNTVQFSFEPSSEKMPPVPDQTIELQTGLSGGEKELLIQILLFGLYSHDQSEHIRNLASEMGIDVDAVLKLGTPKIELLPVYEIGDAVIVEGVGYPSGQTVENGYWDNARDEEGNPIKEPGCTQEVHEHSMECYDGFGDLICGKEEHTAKRHNLVCTFLEDKYTWIVKKKTDS